MENSKENSRRKFLKATTLGTVSVTLGLSAASSFLASCSSSKKTAVKPTGTTGFDQQPLPYSYTALEDVIDAKTMEIHYSKHAAAYSKALKEAAAAEGVSGSLETVLANISKY